jgi:hypothetical protein
VDISKGLVTIGSIGSCATDIKSEQLQADAQVYPNPLPANAWLHINFNTAIAMDDMQIVDILGRKHSFEVYRTDNKKCSLKLSEYAPGIYFVIIPAADGGERIAKQIRIL